MTGIDWSRFSERDLADCVVTRFRGANPRGAAWAPSWAECFDSITTPTPWADRWKHPSFSLASFAGNQRCTENVTEVCAAVLDLDGKHGGGCSEDEIATLCSARLACAYTTKSHTAETPSWRVVLPYVVPYSPTEHKAGLYELAEFLPACFDRAASGDAARFWFAAAEIRGVDYRCRFFDGDAFDLGPWLLRRADRLAMEAQEAASNRDAVPAYLSDRDPTDVETRAIAYLDRLEPSISGASGHKALFRAASVLKRLDEPTAYRLLRDHFNPRCVPKWSDKEILRKVREGAKSTQIGGLR